MNPNDSPETRRAIPLIPFVDLVPGPRAARMIQRIAFVTGILPDEIASHLLESAGLAPIRKPDQLSTQSPHGNGATQAMPAKAPHLRVPVTPETNRRLLMAARAGRLGKGEVAAVWLEQIKGGLPVFADACRALRLLHALNVQDIQVDLAKAIRDGGQQEAPTPTIKTQEQ
ncbi:MAG TPA: hypothetical protein VFE51_27765 [Verrucomicrobiae bacterium]|nr:hypothetical protein [Verrucomicrobiae bacterium]